MPVGGQDAETVPHRAKGSGWRRTLHVDNDADPKIPQLTRFFEIFFY